MRERVRVLHPAGGRQMTKLAEQESSDINVIMRRWKTTGMIPVKGETPVYGDFGSGIDYHVAMNRVRQAAEDFAALPADVRSHVQNDPGAFLDMVFDPERIDELVELGLVTERIPVKPDTPPEPPEPAPEPVPEPEPEP